MSNKSKSDRIGTFRLRQLPMNFDSVLFGSLIIKLNYNFNAHFDSESENIKSNLSKILNLVIFMNSQEAQDNEWATYGPAENSFLSIKLATLGETQTFSMDDSNFKIQFKNSGKTDFYSKNQLLKVDFFEFKIEKIE